MWKHVTLYVIRTCIALQHYNINYEYEEDLLVRKHVHMESCAALQVSEEMLEQLGIEKVLGGSVTKIEDASVPSGAF